MGSSGGRDAISCRRLYHIDSGTGLRMKLNDFGGGEVLKPFMQNVGSGKYGRRLGLLRCRCRHSSHSVLADGGLEFLPHGKQEMNLSGTAYVKHDEAL